MNSFSFSFFFFFFLFLHSSFCFWGLFEEGEEGRGEEGKMGGEGFKKIWESIPERYHEAIFEELKKEQSFYALLREKSIGIPIDTISHKSGAHFSAKTSRGNVLSCRSSSDIPVGYIDVYRLGETKSLPYAHGCTTYRDLIETARIQFDDQKIHQFWNRDGSLVFLDDTVKPLPTRQYRQVLIATARMGTSWEGYKEQERFYFPALEVGEVVPLSIPDNQGNLRDVNITTLSINPKVFMLDPYLSQEECSNLWFYMNNLPKSSDTNWERSSVGQDQSDKSDNTTTRMSETVWLGSVHNNRNELTSNIFTRSQALLHAPTELMEPFQCVRYPPGGHYYFHTDSVPSDRITNNPNPYYRNGGNRYATLLIYVNAPSKGGHTAFPLAKDPNNNFNKSLSLEEHPLEGCDAEKVFHVEVKKGAAVLFYDCLEEQHMGGLVDPLSEHAGCDTSGEEPKVIMNQWYRNKRVKVGDKWHMYDNNW